MSRALASCVILLLVVALAACAIMPYGLSSGSAAGMVAKDISMLTPTEGWAVGNASDGHNSGVMAHDHNGVWRPVGSHITGNPFQPFRLIRMVSATDGWAAAGAQIYHYDGAVWRLTYTPASVAASNSAIISDMAMTSPDDGWAVGEYVVLHYSHGHWQDVTSSLSSQPSDFYSSYPGMQALAVVSPNDIWAFGDNGVIWRYDGAQWRLQSAPSAFVHGGALYAGRMLSPTEGWAVGGTNIPGYRLQGLGYGDALGSASAVIERYHDGAWQVAQTFEGPFIPAPGAPVFAALAMTASGDAVEGWIGGAWVRGHLIGSGDALPSSEFFTHTLLLRYHAGQWTFVSAPDIGLIRRIVMLSPSEGWAAGERGLLHYSSGKWQVVSLA